MTIKKMNFLAAESLALNLAYKQFFGNDEPVGVAYTFIRDKMDGNEWTATEKQFAQYISRQAIADLKRKNLTDLIVGGIVPDCAMARRFMATGSGLTSNGYNS